MADEFKYSEFVDYFRQLAIDNLAIAHNPALKAEKRFYRLDVWEIIENTEKVSHMSLVLERMQGGWTPEQDNRQRIRRGAFSIIQSTPSIDDFEAIEALYDEAELIAEQFVARMRDDKLRCDFFFLKEFDPEKAEFFQIGPVFDNAYGCRVEFEFNTKANLQYDDSKWL